MHVAVTNPRWRGKRSRHSRRMRNPRFYVSGKRPIDLFLEILTNEFCHYQCTGSSFIGPELCHSEKFAPAWFIDTFICGEKVFLLNINRLQVNTTGTGQRLHSSSRISPSILPLLNHFKEKNIYLNSLRPDDAIWRHRSGSTLALEIISCLTAPNHCLNQSSRVTSNAQWDQFYKGYLSHQSLILAWKFLLKNSMLPCLPPPTPHPHPTPPPPPPPTPHPHPHPPPTPTPTPTPPHPTYTHTHTHVLVYTWLLPWEVQIIV